MAKKDVIRVDFSKAEGGIGGVRIPENDYRFKVVKVKKGKSSEKETPGLFVTLKVMEGKHKGKTIPDRLWLTPKSYNRLREFMEAMGLKVPNKAVDIPYKKFKGKELGGTVVDDEPYQGRIRSKIGAYIDLETLEELYSEDDDEDEDFDDDEVDEDEDDEDEDDDSDDDEDEDEDEDDLSEMNRKELKAYIKENDLDVKVKKGMDADDIREAIEEAGEDSDDDDEDDEDELDLDDF